MAARRSPYGERGLKLDHDAAWTRLGRRSPYGERGLKFLPMLIIVAVRHVALLAESVD